MIDYIPESSFPVMSAPKKNTKKARAGRPEIWHPPNRGSTGVFIGDDTSWKVWKFWDCWVAKMPAKWDNLTFWRFGRSTSAKDAAAALALLPKGCVCSTVFWRKGWLVRRNNEILVMPRIRSISSCGRLPYSEHLEFDLYINYIIFLDYN